MQACEGLSGIYGRWEKEMEDSKDNKGESKSGERMENARHLSARSVHRVGTQGEALVRTAGLLSEVLSKGCLRIEGSLESNSLPAFWAIAHSRE